MTLGDIITQALKELTVVASGEVPTAAELNDGLVTANNLLDSFQAERLMLYEVKNTTFTIVSGTQTYSVGLGQTISLDRPNYVDHVNFIDTSQNPDLELPTVQLNSDAWSAVRLKDLTSPYPRFSYYVQSIPTGTLSFWPVPTSSTLLGSVYAPFPLAQFTNLTATLVLPTAYARMLIKNLAVEMMSSYGVNPASVPLLVQQANESRAIVKRANTDMLDLSIDAGALQNGNLRSAWLIQSGP